MAGRAIRELKAASADLGHWYMSEGWAKMAKRSGDGGVRVCADDWAMGGDEVVGADEDERQQTRWGRMARFSLHAARRAARRNVIPDAVEYVLNYGRVLHRTGIAFYFLADRDVPAEDRHTAWVARLVGTVVLVSLDGEIITIYRNRRALPAIRRKRKYRISTSAAPTPDMYGPELSRLTA